MIDHLKTNEQGDYHTFRKTMETRAFFSGWSLLNKQAPLVRVYADGYQRLEIENISDQFDSSNPSWKIVPLRLSKLPDDQKALLEELKQWRKDIETEIPAYDWKAQSSVTTKSMAALVKLFEENCKKLFLSNEENVCRAIPEYFSSPPTKTLLEYFNYQHPGSARAADKLGREHNIEALKLLIEKRNIPLIQRYARTFDNSVSEKALEPAIEKLIITHYADPELKPVLLELLNARYFYRNKKLFDLMYTELLSNNLPIDKKEILTQRILNTHLPNIEIQLFELLPSLPQKQQLNIVKALIGKYKYLPVLSYIEPLLLENTLNKKDFQAITLFALPAMANQKAADLLVALLQKNLDNPHTFLYDHAQRIVQSLTNFPRYVNVDWSVVKKTFSRPMAHETVKSYIYFVKERQVIEESEELLKYITPDITEINNLIIETLISFQNQPLCRQAILDLRHHLENKNSAETNKPPYTFFVNNIIENCKNSFNVQSEPEIADIKLIKKKQELLENDLKRIHLSYQPSFLLLQEEPEDFVTQQQAFINELKKLVEIYHDLLKVKDVHEQIARNTEILGDALRYKLKKHREALQQYETLL